MIADRSAKLERSIGGREFSVGEAVATKGMPLSRFSTFDGFGGNSQG
jgi:hypothetical protein